MKLTVAAPVEPMLAALAREIPTGDGWLYEPKWDGFRALVFRDGGELLLQSRDLKPLGRYFPELERSLLALLPESVVLDGEIIIAGEHGLDFDALLQRIHPAASRIAALAAATPASFVAFDLLAADGENIAVLPFSERRVRLEKLLAESLPPLYLTPATPDAKRARSWFERFEGAGLDGVVAKRLDLPYSPGERVMVKVKHERTADCVVGGFRWQKGKDGTAVGSLLLGLFDGKVLNYVGHAANFKGAERVALLELLAPYRNDTDGKTFGEGRTPGGPSRWRKEGEAPWEPLRAELVCEVAFDHMQGDRFRHAASFRRWRSDKPPRDCTYEQLRPPRAFRFADVFR